MSKTLRELTYERQNPAPQEKDAYETALDRVRAYISASNAEALAQSITERSAAESVKRIIEGYIAEYRLRVDGLSMSQLAERLYGDMAGFGFSTEGGAPPDVIGAAAAWLCTAPEARELNGQWIEGQELTARLGLLPGWDSPGSVSVPPGDGLDA